jgi:hypothetical protein
MNAKFLAIALFCLAAPLAPQAQDTCTFQEENENSCARFVGCINEGETLFKGTSRGWETGKVYGETLTGDVCTGEWKFIAPINKGEGKFTCAENETFDINFFARGESALGVTGVAMTSKGNRVRLWGSADLSAFFAELYPDAPIPGQGYKCGDLWVPLPTEFPDAPVTPKTD